MIDLKRNEIVQGDERSKIAGWVVYFQTPSGFYHDLKDAIKWCESRDLPIEIIRPIVVAQSDRTYEIFP